MPDLLRNAFYALPPRWRFVARQCAYAPADAIDWFMGRRHPLAPPRGRIYTGGGDFVALGQRHLHLLRRHAALLPTHHVLDVGSGIGRTAVALTGFLDPEAGRYEGFDVVREGVEWCQGRITPRYPHFSFRYMPLHNELYNTAAAPAAQFRFPYPKAAFDVVFLMSVFTHMHLPDIAHYLTEIARVLRPGGHCYATFFLYTAATEADIADPRRGFSFPVPGPGFRLMSGAVPAANIALDQAELERHIAAAGLRLQTLVPGHWHAAPRHDDNEFQDIVVMRRD